LFSDSNNTFDTLKTDDPLSAWRHLTLSIKAHPQDLKLHTQRIMLAMNLQLQPYLAGALQDFFVTLKTTGRPLREKMFILVSPLLDNNSRNYFKQWLDEDTDANLECNYYPGAIFISDSCQKNLITNDEKEDELSLLDSFLNENYSNTVDKAHYCIAYGNIEYAQKLLELEIALGQQGQQQSLVEQELLKIYYHSQNKSALDAMSEKMLNNNRVLSADWKKVQNIAKEW